MCRLGRTARRRSSSESLENAQRNLQNTTGVSGSSIEVLSSSKTSYSRKRQHLVQEHVREQPLEREQSRSQAQALVHVHLHTTKLGAHQLSRHQHEQMWERPCDVFFAPLPTRPRTLQLAPLAARSEEQVQDQLLQRETKCCSNTCGSTFPPNSGLLAPALRPRGRVPVQTFR